jgi:hypothetical protein
MKMATNDSIDVCLCLDSTERQCGCGTNHLQDDSRNYHYDGKHWTTDCLFVHLEQTMQRMAVAHHRRRKQDATIIRLVPCSHCREPVGKGHVRVADAVFCRRCTNDTGGH